MALGAGKGDSGHTAAADQLRALNLLVHANLRASALDESLRDLLARTRSALALDAAAILLLSGDGKHLYLRAADPEPGERQDVRITLAAPLAEGKALCSRPKGVFTADDLTLFRPVLGVTPDEAVALPLRGEQEVRGVLLLARWQRRGPSPEEAQLMELAADRAASVLEQSRLFDQVRAGRQRSQVLAQQLITAQEAERRRLARELHDEIGQALTAVKINLQAVQREAGAAVGPRLDESLGIVDQALQQVRSLSLDLRPSLLDDLGLVAALRWYLDKTAQRSGFAVEFQANPPGIRAAPALETTCFRVAQEALTNIVRHAHARRVGVELSQLDDELLFTIRDDGTGFEVAAARQRAAHGGSLGLLGMQERVFLIGGRIEIHSAPGQGTEIQARFPLSSAPSVERRSRRRESP